MDIEEAKFRIVKLIAEGYDGEYDQTTLQMLLDRDLGYQLYLAAIKSLQAERSIREKDKIHGMYWVLTDSGKRKYDLTTKAYVPKPPPPDRSRTLRVVGTGGQTLGYTTAPDNKDCLVQCLGFIVIIAIVIAVVMMS